ncbi:MAG: hypothetical protein IJ608_07010 [Lachnospiraceae bacterium]|nr:hypothetical protein [Lachnospiraceae bacterium]
MGININSAYGQFWNNAVGSLPQGVNAKNTKKSGKTAKSDNSDKTAKASKSEKTDKSEAEKKLSKKAQDYLKKLREKYGDLDFSVADDAKSAQGAARHSDKEYSVIFSSDELEKMADDDEYAQGKLEAIQSVIDMSDRINEEFGFGNSEDGTAKDSLVKNLLFSFDDDGNMSVFARLQKSLGDGFIKNASVTASSADDLFEQVKNFDWESVKAEKRQGSAGFSVDV